MILALVIAALVIAVGAVDVAAEMWGRRNEFRSIDEFDRFCAELGQGRAGR